MLTSTNDYKELEEMRMCVYKLSRAKAANAFSETGCELLQIKVAQANAEKNVLFSQ